MANGRLTERNAAIAEMLSDGEKLKNFYRFIAQNPHINLHDACQIIIERPTVTVCYTFNEWAAMDRRVTKGRKGIAYYDHDGYKQFVFDANDTHGDIRYTRPILPMKRLLNGLDELNDTSLADSEQSDYVKIQSGVQRYLQEQGELTGDGERDGLLIEGIAYSLYSKTGFPKSAGIKLSGLPYGYRENADFVKELYVWTDMLVQDIKEVHREQQEEIKVIDDTEVETVSDEPIVSVEQTEHVVEEPTMSEPDHPMYPLYKRYMEAQKEKPQSIVMVRLGDFYEMLGDSAVIASKELDLTLTGRNVGLPERVAMCGIPYHAADRYVEKMLESRGVVLIENDGEPIYILSHAEAHGQGTEKEEKLQFKDIKIRDISLDHSLFTDDDERKIIDFFNNSFSVDFPETKEEISEIEKTDKAFQQLSTAEKYAFIIARDAFTYLGDGAPAIEDLHTATAKKYEMLKEKYADKSTFIVTEIDDKEPNPFDDKQPEQKDDWRRELAAELGDMDDGQSEDIAEIDEDDVPDASEWEDNPEDLRDQEEPEPEKPKVKVKSTPKKPEKGIKERKRKEQKPISLFDLLESQEKSAEEALIERQLKYGSGVEHGKFRIFDKYNENPSEKAFVEFLKKEYGWGGHGGWNGDDEMHDAKGISMSVRGEQGEYLVQVTLKWLEVAVRIADLIDDDNYFTEKEKREYVEYKVEQNRLREQRAEEERRKNAFINEVIVAASPERKQRILDEYAITTRLTTFSESLKNEYGTTEEEGDGFFAIYNAQGIWLRKGEKNYDYKDRIYLNWNEFADKVCSLIENDSYIEPQDVAEQPRDLDAEEDADWDALIDAGVIKPIERTPAFNRFKELSAEGKAFFDSYQKRYVQDPTDSMWGEVQHHRGIANGICEVSTSGHGGVMIAAELAPHILSPEALQKGVLDRGYCCYEEDSDACIPLRELYDKGILTQKSDYFTQHHHVRSADSSIGFIPFREATEAEKATFFKEWNEAIDRSLGSWKPDYWAARKQAEIGVVVLTPEQRKINDIVDRIVKEGTESTSGGNWVVYFDEFGEDEQFVREHQDEIANVLGGREEVAEVEVNDDGFDTTYYLDYCPYIEDTWHEFESEKDEQSIAHTEAETDNSISVGDRFVYGEREVTVKELNGLYPNQVVVEYEQQSDDSSYTVTKNIDIYDLVKNGVRVKDESAGNTDLHGVLDQSELGGAKARFRGNVEAIKLVNKLYAENRNPTEDEKRVLSRFVGWGGLSQAFDENNESWKKEYAELKGLLSQEDYEQARGSTLNAYYTSKDVIGGIYAALDRFGVKGNNRILEPSMGTGNFFGYMPREIAEGSRLYGVELDNLTGRIAAKLYPQANVQIKGFEDTTFPNDKFDIVVGNVPFGGYGVADSDYNRYNFRVHDYFLAKSIDKVKPNGIVAIVTSKGTMDKLNPSARKYVAERAELLGAIRLPNTAFKQTAGTEAVADILFFRKREEKITDLSGIEWLGTGKTEEGFEINNYFVNHPEMILGTLAEEVGLYGGKDITVKPDGRDLSEAIVEAVKNLPQGFYAVPETSPEAESTTEVDYNVKPMCYKAENGRLYMRVGDEMQEQPIPKSPKDAYQRIQGMIALREELHHILDLQIQGCSDEVLEREQRTLNAQYDLFVKRYGELNSQTNTRLFSEDGDSALLLACEEVDKETGKVSKSDIFFKRTIRPYVVPTSTDDCFEALQISKNERGRVDISYIEELTGKSYDDVLFELGDAVFRNPVTVDRSDKYLGFETSEEYLSGKVVDKLRMARTFAEEFPEYQRNVEALEKMQPTPITASEISVRLGQTWVDKEIYKQFYMELVGVPWWRRGEVELFYNPHDSSWRLDQKDGVRYDTQMKQKEVFGTKRAPAYRLFIDCMNLKATTIYDTVLDADGKEKRVLNQAETIAAREKQNQIKEAFADWIFKNPDRREELVERYNSLFNQIRLPSYDGSYLKFPEMNPAIELRPHQKDAIHRIITSDQSTLLHHVVGSGKTYTMAASIMKMRQLGLCKKAMVAVPNHLVQQWASEWRKLYPNAKILVATKEDLEKDNRQKFVSKVALGDWDGIIIAQSSFAKIPVSTERQIRKLNEEIQTVVETIEATWAENGIPRGAVKNLERIKKTKQTQLKKLMSDANKDTVLTFENLGVDYLYVDEAHYYKNLFLFTKMNNVAGISNAASQRASDLKLKCEYLQELHGKDRGVVFATGTPISNSMTEMYTMQSYLQPSTLKEIGIEFFDGWAADFGETVTSMELAPSGQGYTARTRFAKFTNLPELQTLYRSFSDVITSDMVQLDVPEAEKHVINLKPSDTVIELAEQIAERAEKIHNGGVPPEEDNMLKVTSDGKKLALDPRCFIPDSADEEGSKLNEAAQRIFEIWEETTDKKGTQIVFCDLSTPKVRSDEYTYGLRFDAYNDLKYKLVQKGMPAEEIAFIHDANTDEQKQALFDRVNSGTIRVLIGSTEKCGAGTNVQKRLVALHHLDTPYRPSDMEQREGRIIRQGNSNDKVDIYTYVTERTFDSYSYQILENKSRFIQQITRGDFTAREFEDLDETTLSYAEIKAITAANPRIKRKMEVDTEIARLRVLEGQYKKNLYELQDKIRKDFPEDIRKQELLIERVTLDLMHLQSSKPADPEAFEISVNGKVYTDRKEGGKALTDALYASKPETVIAEYRGFKISMNPMTSMIGERGITLSANGQYTITIGESASGNLTRLDNFIEDFPKRKERLEKRLEQLKSDLEIAKEQAEKPFEHSEHLKELLSEQSELNAELNLDKREESVVIDNGSDSGDDNYRMLPTQGKYREEKIIDEEDKVATMKVDVLPDYSVTQDEMHEYGYKWDGMLPLSRQKALRLWGMGLQVNVLNADDSSKEVTEYGDLTESGKLYGIEKPVWNNFLHNKETVAYFMARLHITSAASNMISEEMSIIDDKFIGKFKEENFKERADLEDFLPYAEESSTDRMKPYITQSLDEFTDRLWREELKMYGWTKDDVPKSIAEYLVDEDLKSYAKKVAAYRFNAQAELMNILDRFSMEEVAEMNLPAYDDGLIVLAKEPSVYLDDTQKTYLPGLLLLQNQVTGDYYVINDASAKGRDDVELEVGETTDVETILAYNGLYDGNPLQEFYSEEDARAYFDEKAKVIHDVKAKSGSNIDAVIRSVTLEHEAFKTEMLTSTPEEVFQNNTKIRLYNEFAEVIKLGMEFLSEKEFQALREEENHHILEQLYNDYLDCEGYNTETYDATATFIKDYCESYHNEIYHPITYYGKDTENRAYFSTTQGITAENLWEFGKLTDAEMITVAAPTCYVSKEDLEEYHIFYLNVGRDIQPNELEGQDAIRNMMNAMDKYNRIEPVYLQTATYAHEHNEVIAYRESHKANAECKRAIDEAIRSNFDGMHLNTGFEDELIEEYGMERVAFIVATTINEHDWDGRYSPTNKEWAKTIPMSESEDERNSCCLNTHPAVLDGFANIIREKQVVLYTTVTENNAEGQPCFNAYALDRKSGEVKYLDGNFSSDLALQATIDQNASVGHEGYTYEWIEPQEFYAMSERIKAENATRSESEAEEKRPEEVEKLIDFIERGEVKKTKAHYAFIYERSAGGKGSYQAYVLEEGETEMYPMFADVIETEEELERKWNGLVKSGIFAPMELIKCEPHELYAMSEKPKAENAAKSGKRTVFYAAKHDVGEEEGKEYIAVYLDEESGEIKTLFGTSRMAENKIDELVYKVNHNVQNPRDYVLVKKTYDELLSMSETTKKEGNTTLADKFEHFTARGDKVLSIIKDRDDRNIAIIQREKMGDFIVAARYDTTDGTWAQGEYCATLEAAEKYRTETYGFENTADTEKKKWVSFKVSPEALIRRYQFNSRFRMPQGSGYEGCAYSVFNDRIKESTITTDIKSDTRERALEIRLPEDARVELYEGSERVMDFSVRDFANMVDGTTADKYERPVRNIVNLPREAIIKEYDKSVLFAMPNDTEYKGYVYYLPNSVINEDKNTESGLLAVSLGEGFMITLRKGEEKVEITGDEFAELCGSTSAEHYKREPTAMDEYREQQGEDDKKWDTIAISENAVISNYENSTLFKMPKGDYAGFVYYIPSSMVRKEDDGLNLRIPEDFTVHLKNGEEQKDLTAKEFAAAIEGKTDEDYESIFRKPSDEAVKRFEKVENQLRNHVPAEMLSQPNWVVVRTRENDSTGRLDKFLISPITEKFAESDNSKTWADFDTACKYAKENGGVCLAYALEWDSDIACIDLDGCMQENGDFSEIANKAFNAANGSYAEKSVSGKGLHIFGKTKGADLRSFSKDKTMEYYQGGHFIAMTGDYYGSSELKSFDTPEMQSVLLSKLEKRTAWENTGKGIEGLSSMDDREMLEKAFGAKNGDTVKRLYNGEDLRGNHSNSDMSLMNYLAFWSNHDIDQMLRVFSTSGLYRPDKPQSYYEHTAIKAVKGTPCYTPPKVNNNFNKPGGNGSGNGSGKDGK